MAEVTEQVADGRQSVLAGIVTLSATRQRMARRWLCDAWACKLLTPSPLGGTLDHLVIINGLSWYPGPRLSQPGGASAREGGLVLF